MQIAYIVPKEEVKLLFKDSKMYTRLKNYLKAIHFGDADILFDTLDIRVVRDDKDKSIKYPIDEINSYKGDWIQVNGVVYQDKNGNRQIDVDISELYRVILTWFLFKSVNTSFLAKIYVFYYKYTHSDNNYDDVFYILPDKYHNIISNILSKLNMTLDTYVRKEVINLTKATSMYDSKK